MLRLQGFLIALATVVLIGESISHITRDRGLAEVSLAGSVGPRSPMLEPRSGRWKLMRFDARRDRLPRVLSSRTGATEKRTTLFAQSTSLVSPAQSLRRCSETVGGPFSDLSDRCCEILFAAISH
jgi:hypothetical protein